MVDTICKLVENLRKSKLANINSAVFGINTSSNENVTPSFLASGTRHYSRSKWDYSLFSMCISSLSFPACNNGSFLSLSSTFRSVQWCVSFLRSIDGFLLLITMGPDLDSICCRICLETTKRPHACLQTLGSLVHVYKCVWQTHK